MKQKRHRFEGAFMTSALTQRDGSGNQLTEATMSAAGFVETKGLARWMCFRRRKRSPTIAASHAASFASRSIHTV